MSDIFCTKCKSVINLKYNAKGFKCFDCGAMHKIDSNNVVSFIEFQCTYDGFMGACTKKCISPNMFCEHHIGQFYTEVNNGIIREAKEKISIAERNIEIIEESKKIWLIQKLGGLNQ